MSAVDVRTGLPQRQYIAALGIPTMPGRLYRESKPLNDRPDGTGRVAGGRRTITVRVIGFRTDLQNREAVGAEIETLTGVYPEYIAQVALTGSADMELVL